MKNLKLFQYVIFFQPTEKEVKDGVKATIIKDITNVLSVDEKEVNIKAAREIPEEYLDRLDQVIIALRPF
jgi:hypothetical protein